MLSKLIAKSVKFTSLKITVYAVYQSSAYKSRPDHLLLFYPCISTLECCYYYCGVICYYVLYILYNQLLSGVDVLC